MLKATKRIALEPLIEAHAVELFPALSHSAIYTFIPGQPPDSVAVLAERFRRLESRSSPDGSQRWLNWVIRRIADQQCIGYVQATIYTKSTADFAFVLAPPFWGLGLAQEACLAALAELFTCFDVTSVFATVDKRNLRSSSLLLRLGFQRVPVSAYPHGMVEDLDDVYQLYCAA
jgi:RimJ/RimL family protein N-acetyltransferase